MGAKGVLRNIKNKGIKETGIIFFQRHIGKEVDKQLEKIKRDVANLEKELQSAEKEKLFAMLHGDMGLKCPHGRPVAVKLTKYEIEKMFKRIV